jgi:DNA-binding NtrC family response regulator
VSMASTILVVDDERSTREALQEILQKEGYEVLAAPGGKECLGLLDGKDVDVVVADLIMPGVNGLELLRQAQTLDPTIKVILVTGYGTIETCVDAMRQGAYHYLTKPVKPKELKELIRKAVTEQRLERENQALKSRLDEKYGFESIIGNSPPIQRILDLVRRIAPTRSTVLITGESGTGKELLASCLHQNSPRRKAAFIKVNCAAIVENLLESELFGHVQGAFTGAIRDKEGKFEAADGGTIFLDEVGEMSLATQAKFLRVLQEGEIERVGDVNTRKVDARVLAATNKNLEQAVGDGTFRQDLYFRLKVVRVETPPLRDRREDIPLFIDHFLSDLARTHGRKMEGIAPPVMERLLLYPWPGNIRELKNVLEGMVVTTANTSLQMEDLPPEIANFRESASRLQVPVGATLEDIEKEMIRRTMASTHGNRTRAAKMLGVSLRTLQRKLKLMYGEEVGGEEGEDPGHDS